MNNILKKVCLLVFVIKTATSLALDVNTDKENELLNVQCIDKVPMIGLVPHPTNCYKFYSCVPAAPGSPTVTVAVEMNCTLGENGSLFYDFQNCSCEYDNSVCYDGIANRADFFKCAKEYDPSDLDSESHRPS